MGLTLEALKHEIDELKAPEKAEILRMLVSELDAETDEDVAQAWVEEARCRHSELAEGKVSPIPAKVVFDRARERLRR